MSQRITLTSLSPFDGWAIVHRDNKNVLLRPPYERYGELLLDEQEADLLLMQPGFYKLSEPIDFDRILDVVAHLNSEIGKKRQDINSVTLADLGKDIVFQMEEGQLADFLGAVNEHLVEVGRFADAENALMAILRAPASAQAPDLRDKTLDVLEGLTSKRQARSKVVEESSAILSIAPLSVSKYGRDKLKSFLGEITRNHSAFEFV